MAIDFVDEGDARLGVFMSAGDDPVPDVGRVDHSRRRWLFNQSIGKIGSVESLFIAEGDGRTIRTAIDDIVAARDRIENGIVPAFTFEVELIPLVAIDRVEKLVSNVDGNIEVRERVLIVLRVNETQNVRMRPAYHAHVCATAHAALLYGVGRRVADIHERDGAAGDAMRRSDHRTARSSL